MLLKYFYGITRQYCRCFSNKVAPSDSRDLWKTVVGLEIHAQLSTRTKLFSSSPFTYGAPPNTCVSLFDAAIPGTLPVLNKSAVELAVLSALALGCKINPVSYFDRKHYFYPDLPAGYQITQQSVPLAQDGRVDYSVYQPGVHKKPYYKTSKIKQIQLEQDSGKTLHVDSEKQSYIDLNRAGIALIEIVFEPDVEDEEEACSLIKEVIQILERAGTCTCKMDEGALRVDANVSIHKEGENLGVRTEIKNIGSVHGVVRAIKNEVKRQLNIINTGGRVQNETLTWDTSNNKLVVLREKEEPEDYRFMPEPNLPPLRILIDDLSEKYHKNVTSKDSILDLRYLKNKLPKMPQDDRMELMRKYGLNDVYAYNLVNQEKLLKYFKEIMSENSSRDSKVLYLFLMLHVLKVIKSKQIDLDDLDVPARCIGEIVDLLQSKRINSAISELVFVQMLTPNNNLTPTEFVEKNNLGMISNPKELTKICLRVLEKEDSFVKIYKKKKPKTVFLNLREKVLKETKYRADPVVLTQVLSDVLDEM